MHRKFNVPLRGVEFDVYCLSAQDLRSGIRAVYETSRRPELDIDLSFDLNRENCSSFFVA